MRSLPVSIERETAEATTLGPVNGHLLFQYPLTPEQLVMYGQLRAAPGSELPIAPLVATRPAGNTERLQLAVQEAVKESVAPCAIPLLVATELARNL